MERNSRISARAARGLGVDLAKAALAAGHAVVATGRRAERITDALGQHDDLLAVALDVTDPAAAHAAVQAAVERFGRLDVVVNNAGSFQAGFFEEMTPDAFRSQIETTLFGPVNVTRAVLPQMRAQRSGLVITISSTAGIAAGGEFLTAYAASKFGVEGFMEALAPEVAPFGVRTADYADRSTATVQAWQRMDGKQGGDPAKLAAAVMTIAALEDIPARFAAGADAVTFSRPRPTTCLPKPTRTANSPANCDDERQRNRRQHQHLRREDAPQ